MLSTPAPPGTVTLTAFPDTPDQYTSSDALTQPRGPGDPAAAATAPSIPLPLSTCMVRACSSMPSTTLTRVEDAGYRHRGAAATPAVHAPPPSTNALSEFPVLSQVHPATHRATSLYSIGAKAFHADSPGPLPAAVTSPGRCDLTRTHHHPETRYPQQRVTPWSPITDTDQHHGHHGLSLEPGDAAASRHQSHRP